MEIVTLITLFLVKIFLKFRLMKKATKAMYEYIGEVDHHKSFIVRNIVFEWKSDEHGE